MRRAALGLGRWLVGLVGLGALSGLGGLGCTGTTGSELVGFDVLAKGPDDAVAGAPYELDTPLGYHVTLERARVHVGALYLNRSAPQTGIQETSCTLPGTYVAQVTSGLEVDALSPEPQPFPVRGLGTSDLALAGEVWLTGGPVDADDDPTVLLDLAGTATRGGVTLPFDARLTIGQNRALPPDDPARPGSNPLCKQRIVSPIPVELTPREGSALVLEVAPRALVGAVDFFALEPTGDPPTLHFADESEGGPNIALYRGLRQLDTYSFTLEGPREP